MPKLICTAAALITGLSLFTLPALAGEVVEIPLPNAAEADATPLPGIPAASTDAEAAPAEDPCAEPPAPPSGPTVLSRSEFTDGNLTQTFALLSEEVIIWGLSVNSRTAQDFEIGKTFWAGKSGKADYSLTGYVAVWPQQEFYFLLPWAHAGYVDGKNQFTLDAAAYLPLNDGPTIFFMDGTSYMRQVTKQVAVGVDTLYVDHSDFPPATFQWGPAIHIAGSEHLSVYARALMFGDVEEDTYRVDFYFR